MVAVNGALVVLGEKDIGAYYTANSIAYFLFAWVCASLKLSPRFISSLNGIAVIIFVGFVYITVVKIIPLLV